MTVSLKAGGTIHVTATMLCTENCTNKRHLASRTTHCGTNPIPNVRLCHV